MDRFAGWTLLPTQSMDLRSWGRCVEAQDKVALRIKQFKALLEKGGSFGVLSAYGPGSKKENQKRNGELFAELQRRGYRKITPLRGSWEGVAEKSVIVPGLKFKDLVELGEKFGQISVIHKSPEGVVGMYYPKEGQAEVAVTPSGELAAKIEASPGLYSKARGVSFEFGFLFGQRLPWNGKAPLGKEQVEAFAQEQVSGEGKEKGEKSRSYKDYLEDKKKDGETPMKREEWESRYGD